MAVDLKNAVEVEGPPKVLPRTEQTQPASEVITIGKDSKFYVKRDGKWFKLN